MHPAFLKASLNCAVIFFFSLYIYFFFVRTLCLDEELSPLLNLEFSGSVCWVEMC